MTERTSGFGVSAERFLAALRARGIGLVSGAPCSYLKPFINRVLSDDDTRYVAASNEGEAVAIAAGSTLGGGTGVAIFQNLGLGNAVNPLTSLTHTMGIPVLLIVTWRGEPGQKPDAPQHHLMGEITPRLLEAMQIPWRRFPSTDEDIGPVLDEAFASMQQRQRPFALVLSKGTVASSPLLREFMAHAPDGVARGEASAVGTRRDVLVEVQRHCGEDLVVATTGYTGRELYALGHRDRQLYMVGSMGCASSLGLGLALRAPHRRVVVVDGDGAALMRLGAWPAIAHERPPNLLHVLVDNGRHESTGGQSTVSGSVDFAALAVAAGYPQALRVSSLDELGAVLAAPTSTLTFVHVRVEPGVPDDLPRPAEPPDALAKAFAQAAQERSS